MYIGFKRKKIFLNFTVVALEMVVGFHFIFFEHCNFFSVLTELKTKTETKNPDKNPLPTCVQSWKLLESGMFLKCP